MIRQRKLAVKTASSTGHRLGSLLGGKGYRPVFLPSALGFLLVALLLVAGSSVASTHPSKLLPPSRGHIYQGAFPDNCASEGCVRDGANIVSFEKLVGKRIAWDEFSDNWFNGIVFPAAKASAIRARGVIPYLRIMPRSDWTSGCKAKNPYALSRIIKGDYDFELTIYADGVADFVSPILIDFAPEANGNWFPWDGVCNGAGHKTGFGSPLLADGPERYRAAYRHLIAIFRRAGATNVTWVMHFDSYAKPDRAWNKMRAYYPGDSFIDWIGVSAYGAETKVDLRNHWNPYFSRVMNDSYPELTRVSKKKPLAVLEWGVTAGGRKPTQAQFISLALQNLAAHKWSRIRAISYWHSNWSNEPTIGWSHLRLDYSPATLMAYRRGIAKPVFTGKARLG